LGTGAVGEALEAFAIDNPIQLGEGRRLVHLELRTIEHVKWRGAGGTSDDAS